MKLTNVFRYFLMAFALLGVFGCEDDNAADANLDEMFSTESVAVEQSKKEAMEVLGVKFSPDRKHFQVFTGMNKDIGPYAFRDSVVTIKIVETIGRLWENDKYAPRLVSVKNTEGDEVARRHIKMLALVDLTLPQYTINKIRDAIVEMQAVFTKNNLLVSFMYGQNVTETMEVTDYVLDTYFKSHPDEYTYLYRSILLKKHEMEDHYGVWADAKKMAMVIFSDEKVYGSNDEPIDPKHFELQETLVNADSVKNSHLVVNAVSLNPPSADLSDNQAESVLKVLCKNTGGLYLNEFIWTELKGRIVKPEGGMIVANEFDFENPSGKVYRGIPYKLRIEIYSNATDSLVGTATTNIFLGTAYNPVIVDDPGDIWMFVQGASLGLLALLLVYFVFQFIIPSIRYHIFKKKYVVKYVNGSMSVGNLAVGESCYFCKAPFQEGEEVVVKCEHTIHKSCWDEIGYHCPEFGKHCQHGAHYYNYKNLFDLKNASFYMKWILVAIVAAISSWFFYMLYVMDFQSTPESLIAQMMEPHIAEVGNSAVFNNNVSGVDQIPELGLFIGFFLTLGLAMNAVRRQQVTRRLLALFIRSAIAAIGSYFLFTLFRYIVLAFNMGTYSALVDWIPWSLTALLIAYCATIGTRVRLKKYVLLITLVLGVLSMYMWSFMFNGAIMVDIRVLLLISCVFFAVGLAVSVAEMAPKSERYFLNVKGAMKEMDIAIFKWFLNDPEQVVTIGKSIDCSLQMSWDIKGQVAPVQCEIRMVGDALRLTALEDGVVVGEKPLSVGKGIWLYHNTAFQIGDTTFTYIERDL